MGRTGPWSGRTTAPGPRWVSATGAALWLCLSCSSVSGSAPQIFSGNQNHDTPELRLVAAVRTRFVRIYPDRATAEGLGLRLELTGCDLDGGCATVVM